ncbi:hypothetical protein [Aureibacillus halotolerans]|uniref:Uncharacterized protein n=1 Tax=Aureibacillus halotolerans TaxID=1508390 RepID=A0A4R6TSX0_9BACI|nr:hypothetical protein [Aureibacillus halotolerans]TDQ34591.1 hypothetical protein EV213_1249 [Aureibacillus halotolerans]
MTLVTILSIAIMALCVSYVVIYFKKRKSGTHKDVTYKLVFLLVYALLFIPLLFLL